ncbi:DUF3097 domain-containing protein [Gleimia sp. 6138-11-ORH1]|uniref:DUF3097 domain-containing protein n=1 Tax=Gleimia sp. 6138-11-ORH1 TaxID=2973937 RepID=UPI0021697D5E|nr:DUF3097 domain-containing protein [Gleimia sp. 6138-11-ORH1]MCS4484188.1 DUF3097 domain-containing protein [Gleimia sp. 6138-11-ORH1]
MIDRYGPDILKQDPHREGTFAHRPRSQKIPAEPGLVVEEPTSGFVGAVIRVEKAAGMYLVELEDRRGNRRSFPLGPGFWVDGKPVELTIYQAPKTPVGRQRTASGSRAVTDMKAKVAKLSRIFVEGTHDAELVEKIWGDDLRIEGVLVEYLQGIDHLEEILARFAPTPTVRVGVLVDHLVPGSKESRIAAQVMGRWPEAVKVVGHPFVDIWQAVKPHRVGLTAWPHIPKGKDIKVGTLQALGLPANTKEDIGLGWKAILSRVRNYRDLEPELLGKVEELIDFVTEPQTH